MIPLTPISGVLLLACVGSAIWAGQGETTPEIMARLLIPIFLSLGLGAFSLWKHGSSFPDIMVNRLRRALWFLPKRSDKDADL